MQGGQIFDNAFCGGGDPNQGLSNTAVLLSASAVNMVKAAIFMGDPRYIYGLPYEVGTCRAKGVSRGSIVFIPPIDVPLVGYMTVASLAVFSVPLF